MLNYIWGNKVPQGEILPNPYTARAMMVAVESGKDNVGSWIFEERNVLQDYRNAFGDAPPPISGVAIMTDTDNTGDTVVAYYGDIEFGSQPVGDRDCPASTGRIDDGKPRHPDE